MLPDPTMLWVGGSRSGLWTRPSIRPPSDNDVGPYRRDLKASRPDRQCGRENHEDHKASPHPRTSPADVVH